MDADTVQLVAVVDALDVATKVAMCIGIAVGLFLGSMAAHVGMHVESLQLEPMESPDKATQARRRAELIARWQARSWWAKAAIGAIFVSPLGGWLLCWWLVGR
jgi:hypothetical protein